MFGTGTGNVLGTGLERLAIQCPYIYPYLVRAQKVRSQKSDSWMNLSAVQRHLA